MYSAAHVPCTYCIHSQDSSFICTESPGCNSFRASFLFYRCFRDTIWTAMRSRSFWPSFVIFRPLRKPTPLLSPDQREATQQLQNTYPFGSFSTTLSFSRAWSTDRAIEPDPFTKRAGRQPRWLTPPYTFVKIPTPAPGRMYRRRAIEATCRPRGQASAQERQRVCWGTAPPQRPSKRHTCTDIEPVRIVEGELFVYAALYDIGPGREHELSGLFEVCGVCLDEFAGRYVLHCDAHLIRMTNCSQVHLRPRFSVVSRPATHLRRLETNGQNTRSFRFALLPSSAAKKIERNKTPKKIKAALADRGRAVSARLRCGARAAALCGSTAHRPLCRCRSASTKPHSTRRRGHVMMIDAWKRRLQCLICRSPSSAQEVA